MEGKIITFYSYKGGVGRSMALANIGVILSQWGYKVLMLDWDFEAPGLEYYFKNYLNLNTISNKYGIIDLLLNHESNILINWENCCTRINLPINKSFYFEGYIDLITSGKKDETYFDKIQKFNFESFYENYSGGSFIESIRNEWKENYDFILVDSRTGVTDIGGVCTIQLPDILLMFFTANEQSLLGTIKIGSNIEKALSKLPIDRYGILTFPIPSRFDMRSENKIANEWIKRFSKDLKPLLTNWLSDEILSDFNLRLLFSQIFIPHIPIYSFGEKLPVLDEGVSVKESIGFAFETIAALISNNFAEVEKLFLNREDLIRDSIKRLPLATTSLSDYSTLHRCFVIGPMQDMARLRRLRDDIIRPLLEPLGFRVITPDEGDIGSVMHQVLLNLEQADLLIADLSGNNPNVMYELGIYHSFGKPYLVLKDTANVETLDKTPFDIATYRFVDIDFNNPEAARILLKDRLDRIIGQLDTRDWFGNPVTDFYQSPVAEIPTAVGLSKNYIKNFLGQLLPDVFLRNENDDNYALEVWVQQPDRAPNDLRLLTDAERRSLTFEILIPVKMQMAEHTYLINLKQYGMETFAYLQARVVRRTRPFNLHYRRAEDGHLVLTDVPTVLSTLYGSIQSRRYIHADRVDNDEWSILEAQELERFAGKCDLFAQNLVQRYPITRNRIAVERR